MHATLNLLPDAMAAGMLSISVRALRKLVREGRVPHVTLPTGEVRFQAEDLAEWVDGLKTDRQDAGDIRERMEAIR